MLLGERPHDRGQSELLERRHLPRDDAEGEADGASLPVGVDAKPGQVLLLVGDVEIARLAEALQPLGRALADVLEDRLERPFVQGRDVERHQSAVAAENGRAVHLEVDVARAQLDCVPEQAVEVHG